MMTPLVKKTIGFAPNGAVNLAKRFRPSGYFPIASTRGAENNRSRRSGKKGSQPTVHRSAERMRRSPYIRSEGVVPGKSAGDVALPERVRVPAVWPVFAQ